MIAYRLFSLLFSYPTREDIDVIKKLSQQKPISTLESIKLINIVDLKDLQTEYTRLFINSYPTLPCPPYESFYREDIVYGKTVSEVTAIYRLHGLAYTYKEEPPDHIGVELDFLAETGDKDFLDRMRQWVLEFTGRVKEHSTIFGVFARELEELL